jgi:HEPN domain
MTNIDQLHRDIKRLYEGAEEPSIEIPLALQAYLLAHVAAEYIGAASILEKESPRFWLQTLQLTGHAMECSLKACLAAANVQPPNKHDLVELCKLAGAKGFTLDDPNLAMIVHLNHLYYQDLATGTKFKTRYPAKAVEQLGGAVPSHSTFVAIIRGIVEQARQRTALPYQVMFDTLQLP